MKKLLFALALFSIMPLCAMEKEIKKEKPTEQLRDALSQFALDLELDDTIRQSPSSPSAINSLLARGANPNNAYIRMSDSSMKVEQSSILRALLDSGFDMLATSEFCGETIFHELALLKAPQFLALWLLHAQERGLDLKKIALQKNPSGATPLSQAQYSSLFPNDDGEKKVLILTDPNKYISQFFPELIEQVQQEQIDAKLKKASAPSLHSYLQNRKIGGKR